MIFQNYVKIIIIKFLFFVSGTCHDLINIINYVSLGFQVMVCYLIFFFGNLSTKINY